MRYIVVYCRTGCNGHLVTYPPAIRLDEPICNVGKRS